MPVSRPKAGLRLKRDTPLLPTRYKNRSICVGVRLADSTGAEKTKEVMKGRLELALGGLGLEGWR